ncbi:spermatid-specific linker histone H1-like protein [Tachyglossus aculeatus]|uniref:spermatid-specific linker histone H1-like protein n=1 Tax=Tachyglossus aculeatus TaxID=9261 RepID=UPI0018F34D60|nr:spermatid-specific linker histone H1-like protein [Tachyglossus aculeatus]
MFIRSQVGTPNKQAQSQNPEAREVGATGIPRDSSRYSVSDKAMARNAGEEDLGTAGDRSVDGGREEPQGPDPSEGRSEGQQSSRSRCPCNRLSDRIFAAIANSSGRKGISLVALKRELLENNYDVRKNNFRINKELQNLVNRGVLKRISGRGASSTFKVVRNPKASTPKRASRKPRSQTGRSGRVRGPRDLPEVAAGAPEEEQANRIAEQRNGSEGQQAKAQGP